MNIPAEKLNLIELIMQIKDVALIEDLKSFINSKTENNAEKVESDFWDELSEEDKKSIAIGLQEVKDGKTRPYEEFIKPYEKYL